MTFYNKIKWVLGLLLIFVLIITTNLIDRDNFNTVKEAVVTIYEDRLVAKEIIFKIQSNIHEKELAYKLSDTAYFNLQYKEKNKELKVLINRFNQTKLTKEETLVFENLKNNISKLIAIDSTFNPNKNSNSALNCIKNIKETLSELSQIQIVEGNKQMNISKKAVDAVELFTHIEIYFLVFLAIVIQIIVMYNPKKATP